MVEFITGAAGSGKTTYMFGRIKESSAYGNRQCIIVPEQYSHDFDKKLYFYLGAESFNELFSLSFTGLARQLFQLFGEPDRKGEFADDMAKMILVYQAVSAAAAAPGSLRYFKRQSAQSGFAEEIMKLIADMKRSGVSPHELLNKAQLFDTRLMDKTSDIAAIYLEYQRLMEEYGFKDELDNIREAAKAANLNRYFEGRNVYIDEFESFTADQIEMLRVIISSADNVCITLRTDDVNAGEFTLFETVNDTYRKITAICRELKKEFRSVSCDKCYRFRNPELEYVSRRALRNLRNEPESAPKPENVRIFEARDMYSETEYVCAAIKRLIYEDESLMYRDIAIISNDIAKYADVLKAAFKRYDIPYFLSLEKPVTHTAVMVYFTTLLDILSARKFRSEQIFRLLKSGLLEIPLTGTSLLENYCYKWGVDGEMWTKPFTAPDEGLEYIEKLRASVMEPLIKLKKRLSRTKSAAKICALLYDHISECRVERTMGRLMNDLIKKNRDYEAAELKRLWGCLIDILDSICDTLGEREISFSEAARIMRSMIGRIKYSLPPQTLDAVAAASARTARLNAPKIVFIMGACDGDFPNQIELHGLFSEADKTKLAENGVEISTPLAELIASERLVVYKAISAASEKLFVTYPLSDLSGQAKYPAQIVDRIIGMFGDESIRTTESDISPHFYAVTLHSAFYHYMQERDSGSPSAASIKSVLLDEPDYKRRLSYVLSRGYHRQNYIIEKSVMEQLQSFQPLRLSSTGLEEYNLCHFKYFCDKCLRLHENERMELDARIAGELTHECFFGILGSRTKEEFINMSCGELRREIDERANKYRDETLAGDFGKDAKFALIFNKLTERMSDIFLHTQHSLMASQFVPRDFELDLRDSHSVVLPFGDGKTLSFGGIVDRADVCRIGDRDYLRIIDYKSSQKDITAKSLAGGINMQMLLYLFAATDKGGIYEGYEPAGVLYSPVRISNVSPEDHKVDSVNEKAVSSSLKTSGLVLGDMDVLEAMEQNIRGEFIPVKLDKDGVPDKYSDCITEEGMKRLREYTYGKLTSMAESLLSGNAEAVPLIFGGNTPCTYCGYINICDNSEMNRQRTPDPESLAEAEDILGQKYEKKEENEHGLD